VPTDAEERDKEFKRIKWVTGVLAALVTAPSIPALLEKLAGGGDLSL
jgi:hypothetical protein